MIPENLAFFVQSLDVQKWLLVSCLMGQSQLLRRSVTSPSTFMHWQHTLVVRTATSPVPSLSICSRASLAGCFLCVTLESTRICVSVLVPVYICNRSAPPVLSILVPHHIWGFRLCHLLVPLSGHSHLQVVVSAACHRLPVPALLHVVISLIRNPFTTTLFLVQPSRLICQILGVYINLFCQNVKKYIFKETFRLFFVPASFSQQSNSRKVHLCDYGLVA